MLSPDVKPGCQRQRCRECQLHPTWRFFVGWHFTTDEKQPSRSQRPERSGPRPEEGVAPLDSVLRYFMRSSLSLALSICPFLFSLCPFVHLPFLLSVHLLSLSLSLSPSLVHLSLLSLCHFLCPSLLHSFIYITYTFTFGAEAFIQRALQLFIQSTTQGERKQLVGSS